MNVLHGGASRADCYEKHTSTDTDTHTLLHFNPTRNRIARLSSPSLWLDYSEQLFLRKGKNKRYSVKKPSIAHFFVSQSRLTDAVSVIWGELLSYEHPPKRIECFDAHPDQLLLQHPSQAEKMKSLSHC